MKRSPTLEKIDGKSADCILGALTGVVSVLNVLVCAVEFFDGCLFIIICTFGCFQE